jgi:hypothetical protein
MMSSPETNPGRPRLSRRRFLQVAATTGALAAAQPYVVPTAASAATSDGTQELPADDAVAQT